MTGADRITALEANALADGELVGQAEAEARRALEADEQLRAVAGWRDTLERQLHAKYDTILSEPIPPAMRRLLKTGSSWGLPGYVWQVAAAAVVAVAAAGFGYLAGQHGALGEGEMERIARFGLGAHQVYASEIRHPVEVAGSDSAHLASWLGKRLGLKFDAPDINDAGFALVGGRLLAEGTRPAALLMYEDATGRRVTLYMEKWPTDEETSLRYLSSGGLNSDYWIGRGFACAVSGNLDSDRLRFVAERLYAALDGK